MQRISPEKERQAIELYRQGLSEAKVGGELGISHTTVHRVLVRNGESRRCLSEACMKYPKTDFSDDAMEQLRIIGFMEDCSARFRYNQIEVQTTTTHTPHMKLFNEIFGTYGHMGRTLGYNKQHSHYHWNLCIFLNQSFAFVIEYKMNPLEFLRAHINEDGNIYIYIGSLTDAEGYVGIYNNNGYPAPVLTISNNNRQLLEWVQGMLGGCIDPDRDCYQLRLYGEDALEALREIPIMHGEKAAAKELILRHADNGGIRPETSREYQALRRRIDDETRLCTMQARLEYIIRHGKPHRNDQDQTIPPNLALSPSFSFVSTQSAFLTIVAACFIAFTIF